MPLMNSGDQDLVQQSRINSFTFDKCRAERTFPHPSIRLYSSCSCSIVHICLQVHVQLEHKQVHVHQGLRGFFHRAVHHIVGPQPLLLCELFWMQEFTFIFVQLYTNLLVPICQLVEGCGGYSSWLTFFNFGTTQSTHFW